MLLVWYEYMNPIMLQKSLLCFMMVLVTTTSRGAQPLSDRAIYISNRCNNMHYTMHYGALWWTLQWIVSQQKNYNYNYKWHLHALISPQTIGWLYICKNVYIIYILIYHISFTSQTQMDQPLHTSTSSSSEEEPSGRRCASAKLWTSSWRSCCGVVRGGWQWNPPQKRNT